MARVCENSLLGDDKNRSAVVDWVNDYDLNSTPNIYNLTRSSKYKKWLIVNTGNATTQIVRHFKKIEAFLLSQQKRSSKKSPGFIWAIQPTVYDWRKLLTNFMQQRHNSSMMRNHTEINSSLDVDLNWRSDMQPFGVQAKGRGCPYAVTAAPKELEKMAQMMFDQMSQNFSSSGASLTQRRQRPKYKHNNPLFPSMKNMTSMSPRPWIGYFHVRRGDATKECNTTLARIKKFLNCSLGQPLSILARNKTIHWEQRRPVILLFSSDEASIEYRRSVLQLIEEQGLHDDMVKSTFTVSGMDLDVLGRNVISTFVEQGRMPAWRLNNNLYLFRLLSHVTSWSRPEISFRLELRRTTCPSCYKFTWQMGKSKMIDF